MAKIGDVIFVVQYCPSEYGDSIHAAGEWPGDAMKEAQTKDFRKAEAFAINHAADDYFGCTSIQRMECENPKYGWWEQTGFWEVTPETQPGQLNQDNPDH